MVTSHIIGNQALGGFGTLGGGDAEGGGLDNSSNSTATIDRSTVVGNRAVGGDAANGKQGRDFGDEVGGGLAAKLGVNTVDNSVTTVISTVPLTTQLPTIIVSSPAVTVQRAVSQVIPITPQASPVPLFALSGANQASPQLQSDVTPPVPARLTDLPPLPTEREILAGMNVAGSLLRQTRPQANLVPQPGDPVAVVGALTAAPEPTRPDRAPSRPPAATTAPAWAPPVNPQGNRIKPPAKLFAPVLTASSGPRKITAEFRTQTPR